MFISQKTKPIFVYKWSRQEYAVHDQRICLIDHDNGVETGSLTLS